MSPAGTTPPRAARVEGATLAELRRRYVVEGLPLPRPVECRLRADGRAGARAILDSVQRRRRRNRAEGQRLRRMLRHERMLWEGGATRVAGVDEVGMAPLAGPVVAAAVILAPGYRLARVDDSKKLDAPTRERLAAVLRREAVAWSLGSASPEEIDRINIHRAGLLAMRRAVEGLHPAAEQLLIDARTLPELTVPQRAIVHGDEQSLCIAAASIIAKVARDALMTQLDARYPGYGFARHKGYPVHDHTEALSRLGVTPVHRRSFAPVREALDAAGSRAALQSKVGKLGCVKGGAGRAKR